MCILGTLGLGLQCTEDVRIVGEKQASVVVTDAGVEPEPWVPFSPPRIISELSDPDADETEPTLTEDELEIYFASTRFEGRKQIFTATRRSRSDRFGEPSVVAEFAYPTGNSMSPELARDGLSIWFISDREGGPGGGDMYLSTRSARGEPWSAPTPVTEINTETCEIDPGPLPEYNQFIVTRCNENWYNHIFFTQRASADAPWEPLVYLDQLNSVEKEGDPAFANNGLSLYFATTRDSPNRDDRADIWRATRASLSAPFEAPLPVVELNILEVDDQDPWVSNDERHIVFTSRRDRGPREIYEAFR